MNSISNFDVNLLNRDNVNGEKYMNITCDGKPIVFKTLSFQFLLD